MVCAFDNPTICLQANGIGRKLENGCNGKGWRYDASYTLNTIDIPAVVDSNKAYGFEPGAASRMNPESRISEECSPTLRANMGDNQVAVCKVYEQHSQDARYNPMRGGCPKR